MTSCGLPVKTCPSGIPTGMLWTRMFVGRSASSASEEEEENNETLDSAVLKKEKMVEGDAEARRRVTARRGAA